MNFTAHNNSNLIKSISTNLGFSFCGISKADVLNEDAHRLENWLKRGFHGKMKYMENHFDLRIDPRKLVPGAKSVITLLLNYFPTVQQKIENPVVAKYAFGEDYHDVIRMKLENFLFKIREQIGEVNGRGFTDSAPILERSWAQKSGLGWVGKNGNLINKQSGSFYFIATLITDLELVEDAPYVKDYCGSCTRCIDACPTDAILEDKVIDGSKCISYYTIELKDLLLPADQQENFENRLFGCDTCQDVCPWNRFALPTNEVKFTPLPQILNFSKGDWEELSEESFKIIFKDSPIKRTKYTGIKRNLKFIS